MGVSLMGVFGTSSSITSHMCNMISSPSAKGLPLLIAKRGPGPCVGEVWESRLTLLHASCCGNLSQNTKFVMGVIYGVTFQEQRLLG